MKYFSPSKIALLLAFVSQVHGSEIVESAASEPALVASESALAPLYKNPCLIKHFGLALNYGDMKQVIYDTVDLKVITAAFVECPFQMTKIYYDRVLTEGAYNLVEALKQADTDEGSTSSSEEFLDALKSVLTAPKCHSKSKATALDIYQAFFIEEYLFDDYLDRLQLHDLLYMEGWIVRIAKAIWNNDEYAKANILSMLSDDQERIKARTENVQSLISFIDFMKLMIEGKFDNINIDFENVTDISELNYLYDMELLTHESAIQCAILLALGCNNYELAAVLVGIYYRNDNNKFAYKVMRFMKIHLDKYLVDPDAAYAVTKFLFEENDEN